MSKAELLEALSVHLESRSPLPKPPASEPASHRRSWAYLLDLGQRCGHGLGLGAACDYPLVKGASACTLHGGMNISDLAVPASGELGPHTWSQLRRHQRRATYDPDPLGLDPVTSELLAQGRPLRGLRPIRPSVVVFYLCCCVPMVIVAAKTVSRALPQARQPLSFWLFPFRVVTPPRPRP